MQLSGGQVFSLFYLFIFCFNTPLLGRNLSSTRGVFSCAGSLAGS